MVVVPAGVARKKSAERVCRSVIANVVRKDLDLELRETKRIKKAFLSLPFSL